MSFTRVQELTPAEALALALVELKQDWFTEKSLVSCLCLFLSERLTPGAFSSVAALVKTATAEGLIEICPGPKGAHGIRITARGIAVASDIDLPRERVIERGKLEGERYVEANANPAPVLIDLLRFIPANRREFEKELSFLCSVFDHWRDHGWLSSKQVAVICEIGSRHGLHIHGHHLVGRAMDEWRQPYIEAERVRREQEYAREVQERARKQAAQAAKEREWRERAQRREAALKANREVKALLKQMEQDGEMAQLDLLVPTIFPNINLTPANKATAYAGAGSKELRTCIAAFAFGKPPSLVWEKSGQLRQPDADSAQWQTVINHRAFQELARPLLE
jgi:hypothetical protein